MRGVSERGGCESEILRGERFGEWAGDQAALGVAGVSDSIDFFCS